ncbi:hypothetical protein [Streptomyces sp. NK15101]|uniref:hypothetical protein n=1 Tax=Streptomyces sp. NK15101 TaxID=2873261 RepID=UPI001CED24EF|nr:hypothetical protein [Streptomyces sp. NK15101]
MTHTEFGNISFLWGWWTFFEAVWIATLWRSRTRVLGGGVYRLPGVRRVRRNAAERRVDALLAELERLDVPAEAWPDRCDLVDRWHRIVAGRCVSALLQVVPVVVTVVPFWWAAWSGGAVAPWMPGVVAGFTAISLTLMAADYRAAVVSDAAGVATVDSVRFLELVLFPATRRTQDSALEVYGRGLSRLCNSLSAQARHTTRTMPPEAREGARVTAERLTAALSSASQRYLFSQGADRDRAVRGMALLAAGALRQSCRPRHQHDSLVIIEGVLLAEAPEVEVVGATAEPLRARLLAGLRRMAVAVGLVVGAFLFPEGGIVPDLLGAAGLASIALVCAPLREALHRARELIVGGSPTSVGSPELEVGAPASPAAASCARCAGREGGSRQGE